MSGATVTKLLRNVETRKMTITPEIATSLLEKNKINRPLSDAHVKRIAAQISGGKWKYNGDTIKLSDTEDVLDGQHRLWAVIESQRPIETLVAYGIEREAFATVDTLRKPRSGGDVIALAGVTRHRNQISEALKWLLRWQRGKLEEFRAPENRIENSDVEMAFAENPTIVRAVERAATLRSLGTPSVLAFIYYVIVNRNPELAERMMTTLEDPAGIGVNDPFYRLRMYFVADHHRRKEPLVTIALAFKAANAANEGRKLQALAWRSQGKNAEEFPKLQITPRKGG